MENKMYLINEIYDSLSYKLINKAEQFYSDYNNMLLAPRRFGKTTMAFIDAISECSMTPNLNLLICIDTIFTSTYYDLLINFCNDLGVEYAKDTPRSAIVFLNGSQITVTNTASLRGRRFDYVIADMHYMQEDAYTSLLCCNALCYKFIVGVQTDFVREFINANPTSFQVCTFEDLEIV